MQNASITKSTLIPLSIVSSLLMAAFWVSSFWVRLGETEAKVEKVEVKTSQREEDLQKFEKEIIERLSRIEGAIQEKNEGK